ncbi:MAG: type I-U CRISPR-associated helicase/endonuclease Cas3 [Nitrospira sp.]|nr:type I-U CRISPR-associated helicase/endonuclease Cas3 [Nitrospira sp.]
MSDAFPDFPTFFKTLWEYEPFPWQTMLAERVARDSWPRALDLPTAAGKTACIDIAVYALACQADVEVDKRSAPRRIWFVVDRRIVVDEAYARAERMANKLRQAADGPLKQVADRLRQISGTDRPLAVARLRGGIFHDDGWGRVPSQPAVVTSTVDQLGSRLLFRGYGRSDLTASIFAGLAAHDSLILLDEAHCSVPFLQTMRSIERYRGEQWAEQPIRTPFAFVILSATPPSDMPDNAVFPGGEREKALDHPTLQARLGAAKPAELVAVKTPRGNETDDPLVEEAVRRVEGYCQSGRMRVAVIVNRVHTAGEIARLLWERMEDKADVVLLTGRIRPYERDCLVRKWGRLLRAVSPEEPQKPIVLVATQCIEVGADFSFDALITECASLDALRQRFGRLNRMGQPGEAPGAILIRDKDVENEEDRIYGAAMSATWRLLNEKAPSVEEGKKTKKVINFGFEALKTALDEIDDLSPYLSPQPDAPVLFPAYLDLLCQTSQAPHPEPDIQLFLHGKERGAAEVQVIWRADLFSREAGPSWIEIISLCPPTNSEMLSVPLYRLIRWLAQSEEINDDADLEGERPLKENTPDRIRPCLIWRGRKHSVLIRRASDILPNDVVVLPAEYGIAGLGQSVVSEAMGKDALDLWEPSQLNAGHPPALRLNRAVLQPWLESCPPLGELLDLAEAPDWERDAVQKAIDAVLEYRPEDDGLLGIPPWLSDLLQAVRNGRFECHPGGGILARAWANSRNVQELDPFADEDDLTSAATPAKHREVSLSIHSESVKWAVDKLATRCLPQDVREPVTLAAYWHDVGKLDERFQFILRQGNELAVTDEPLAKSADIPMSLARRRFIREASGLPDSFRHEMLSAQLAERCSSISGSEESMDLVLHLIASHHGYARPFAPVSIDQNPPPICGQLGQHVIRLSAEERAGLIPPHRVDSGIPERFWRLTRRYGWWGLAYLEAILRLGDWYGSVFIITGSQSEEVS